MSVVKENRIGYIKISRFVLEHEQFSILEMLFAKFIPIKAEFDCYNERFVYLGYSRAFYPVGAAEVIPEYAVHFHNLGDRYDIEFFRVL